MHGKQHCVHCSVQILTCTSGKQTYPFLEKGRAPLLGEERERGREGWSPTQGGGCYMQPGPPSRKEASVATCFAEQQHALQAPKGERQGLTLPGCEQVLGMQHKVAGLRLPGPQDAGCPSAALLHCQTKNRERVFFFFDFFPLPSPFPTAHLSSVFQIRERSRAALIMFCGGEYGAARLRQPGSLCSRA